ncbi:Pre-rRNA-processing protein TSR2-domain-containing protein [Xylariales sp. AK1849]|nr:Pre-rRNA-processing protein TSR2-domain-containing protein [Xylariales sp. AK1849]
MATQTDHSPGTKQQNFEQSVAFSLHLWPALTLAVQNSWSANDAEDVRDWFAGAVVELFPSFVDLAKFSAQIAHTKLTDRPAELEEPELQDVESRLLQVMEDEFDVNVDDGSGFEVAEQIVRLRASCMKGQFAEVEQLRNKWVSGKGKKVVMQQAPDQDQDTDWESADDDDEDDGSDIDMDEAPALVSAPKEKPPPEIDEDGFQKVTRKKK